MYSRVSISYPSPDGLSEVEYTYTALHDLDFLLDGVVHRSRPTKRHAMRMTARWSRLMTRENTMPRPEVPENVKADVRAKVIESVRFI